METKEILKFYRECDSWLCPECDRENDMSLGKCSVCGCKRHPEFTVLKKWTETENTPSKMIARF